MFEMLERSKFECGYDPKFKEEETLLIVDAIKDAYINGYKQNTIVRQLKDDLGLNMYVAQMVASKAWKMLMVENHKREEGMREKNLGRLEKIYADAMDSNDPKTALAAIDQLSKLTGLYKEKIEVEQINSEFVIGGEEGAN